MIPTKILAFGFGNLAMLGWLAAIAAPLVIHLWSRHRYREAPWAAMQFLLAAMRKNARRLQLQQWLLLAVRMLIIALVVLAVAEPYGERLLANLSGEPTHRILVIDGSYSMAYRDDAGTRFERAKQIAAQLVRDSRSADTFTVVLMATPAETIVGRDVVDHAAVVSQIEALTQPHTGADLAGALTLVAEAIERNAANAAATIQHQVCFITDLQRLTWEQPERNAQQNSVAERIDSLAKLAELTAIDLGNAQSANTAITNVTSSESVVTVGRELAFDATLRHFGPTARTQCAVELLVDNVPVGEQSIDLESGAEKLVQFKHRFQSPGEHTMEVRASGDRLEIDNSRWLVVPVRDEVRVLCVAGRPGAAKYIADALNPSPAGDSPIRPDIVSDGDLAEVELSDFDCIVMCNVAQISPSDAERLKHYAQAGGGIVFFLGDRADRQNYNAQASGSEPLLPATLGEVVDQSEFGIDPLDYRHPIVAPFRGQERAGLLTTPVARYHQLELPKDRPRVQVAAAMRNGDPFIVTAPLGRGHTVLIATDGSLSSVDAATGEPWTNWPTWPSFLPVVRELLTYATSGSQQRWQQLVGTPLASRDVRSAELVERPTPDEMASASSRPNTRTIKRPDKRIATITIQSTSAGPEWSYSDTDLNGIYTLTELSDDSPSPQPPAGLSLSKATPSPHHFAVNVDTRESDLAPIDPRQLPAELHLHNTANNQQRFGDTASLSRAGWNESLLWAALLLVFIESFLAWQFGRGAL